MNKTELIAAVAEKCGIKKNVAEAAVVATFDAIAEELAKDGKIQVIGFGSFEVKNREARVGRNPKTNESIEIPATKYPVFKAGKALKEKVAK
jgi:DNA-binding protein HU-beta